MWRPCANRSDILLYVDDLIMLACDKLGIILCGTLLSALGVP